MSHIETLYFIHHSHTDIGYTHDQPVLFDLHERFLTQALDLADRYADSDTDGAFRWTVENTYVLSRWLQHATPAQIERFQTLEKAGRIEVTGMFANLTPLLDSDELIESFQLLRPLREQYGFTITSAMNCDVNGENWPLVDLLADLGIEGFTMAINTHFGGAPLNRPDLFQWEGPSGRKILAYSGWPYDQGWRFGIGRSQEEFETVWWPRVVARLEQVGYPLPDLMIQSYHPFGDNGSAFEGFTRWVDEWNAAGKSPRIALATPRQWWAAVKQHRDQLPSYRGDWTDFWNFGAISSAREQTINRQSRARLRVADAFAAAVLGAAGADADPWLARSLARHRTEAWNQLILWDEHTWGADISVRVPDGEDTASQWNAKASFAYQARSLSLMLQRDALAALARMVEGKSEDILVANPLPWARTITGEVLPWILSPRGTPDDTTAGRHFQDHHVLTASHLLPAALPVAEFNGPRVALPPINVPAFGYAVVPRNDLVEYTLSEGARPDTASAVNPERPGRTENNATHLVSESAVIETPRYRLVFDREQGGIVSLYDKTLRREWVDGDAGHRFNRFVHEEVADREHNWPRHRMFFMEWKSDLIERPRGWKPDWRALRRGATRVLSHNVYHTPLGIEVIQTLEAPGVVGAVVQSNFLPNYAEWIEFRSQWRMGLDPHPEATYLLFPFELPEAEARFDLGPQAVRPGVDQISGVCFDYYTVQNWVDFSNNHYGVTIATPDNPMVQFGDFHFADNQYGFKLERPTLLGWVTNSYWETNFRAHQPGMVAARYRVMPHAGPFDEGRAHRFGMEAAYDAPLLQHMGEPKGERQLPPSGTLLRLPVAPVVTLHVKPAAGSKEIVVRMQNASDTQQTATIGSALLRVVAAAPCDLLETATGALDVVDGSVNVTLPPRRIAVVKLQVEQAFGRE